MWPAADMHHPRSWKQLMNRCIEGLPEQRKQRSTNDAGFASGTSESCGKAVDANAICGQGDRGHPCPKWAPLQTGWRCTPCRGMSPSPLKKRESAFQCPGLEGTPDQAPTSMLVHLQKWSLGIALPCPQNQPWSQAHLALTSNPEKGFPQEGLCPARRPVSTFESQSLGPGSGRVRKRVPQRLLSRASHRPALQTSWCSPSPLAIRVFPPLSSGSAGAHTLRKTAAICDQTHSCW